MKTFLRFCLLVLLSFLTACPDSNPPVQPPPDPTEAEVEEPAPLTTADAAGTFAIKNTGNATLNYSITVSNNSTNPQSGNWLSVSPSSGSLAQNQTETIALTLLDGLAAGLYKAVLTVNYNGGSQSFEVVGSVEGQTQTSGSFTLSSDGFTNTLLPGATVQDIPIFISRTNFTGAIDLELFGTPEGITGFFTPNPANGNQAELTLSSNGDVKGGDYTFSVRGKNGAKTASVDINLFVVSEDDTVSDFNLSLSPASRTVQVDSSATVTVEVRRRGDFSDAVDLSVEGLPAGVTASFDPDPADDSSTLVLEVAEDAAPNAYTLTVKGTADGKTRQADLALTIKGAAASQDAEITGKVRTDNDGIDIRLSSLASSGTEPMLSLEARPLYVAGEILVRYHETATLSVQGVSLEDQTILITQDLERSFALVQKEAHLPVATTLFSFSKDRDVLALASRLAQDPRVKYAEPNYYLYTTKLPNDTLLEDQWGVAAAGLPVAWDEETGSSNEVVVAVIDSGFDLDHPDLAPRLLPGKDFCSSSPGGTCQGIDNNPSNGQVSNNHGTHVAGIVGAAGNNSKGIAGTAYGSKIGIVPIKVFSESGGGATSASFINGIRWAAGLSVSGTGGNDNPADIINMSLGGTFSSDILQEELDNARNAGALLVAATGNANSSSILSPAAAEDVIGVGAINRDFRRSCFSNFSQNLANGPGRVDIVAPGGGKKVASQDCFSAGNLYGIMSTIPNDDYGEEAGTSMATPMVAGVAALIKSKNPNLSVDQLEQRLLAATYYDASYMNANEYGNGVLRAEFAFGLPGPGDSVTVTASGSGDSAVDVVELNLFGESDSFSLSGLKAGTYTVEAAALGDSKTLEATKTVTLSSGESETTSLTLKP